MSLMARQDKISIDLSYRLSQFNALSAKINWFRRKEVKRIVPCVRFGIRRNFTLREYLEEDDDEDRSKMSTKLAAAIELMLR